MKNSVFLQNLYKHLETTYINWEPVFALYKLLAKQVELWTRLGEAREPDRRQRTKFPD